MQRGFSSKSYPWKAPAEIEFRTERQKLQKSWRSLKITSHFATHFSNTSVPQSKFFCLFFDSSNKFVEPENSIFTLMNRWFNIELDNACFINFKIFNIFEGKLFVD